MMQDQELSIVNVSKRLVAVVEAKMRFNQPRPINHNKTHHPPLLLDIFHVMINNGFAHYRFARLILYETNIN